MVSFTKAFLDDVSWVFGLEKVARHLSGVKEEILLLATNPPKSEKLTEGYCRLAIPGMT